MSRIQSLKNEIVQIKNHILEVTIIVLLVASLPLMLSRIITIGMISEWQVPDLYLMFTLVILSLLIAFNKFMHFTVKLVVCISVMLLGGIINFVYSGLLTGGIIYFVIAALLSSMVEKRQYAYYLGMVIVLINGLIIYLFLTGKITLHTDAAMLITSSQSYIQRLMTTVVYVFVIVFSYTRLMNFLNDFVVKFILAQEEMDQVKEQALADLEVKVNERTEELKLAIEELSKKEKLASMASLVSGVAHEINTPLGVIISSMSYLERLNQLKLKSLIDAHLSQDEIEEYAEEIENCTEIVQKSLKRVNELVSEFKKLSVDIETEQIISIPICALLKSMKKSYQEELEQKQIALEIVCDTELLFESFPSSITQLCNCFINNAITHAFTKECGTIIVRASAEANMMILSFEDNGEGIEESNRQRIFEPFFTTARNKHHVGLGLAIAYTLVTEKLGGSVYLDESYLGGSKFVVKLPLKQEFSKEDTV